MRKLLLSISLFLIIQNAAWAGSIPQVEIGNKTVTVTASTTTPIPVTLTGLGQTTMVNSLPVVVASNQSNINVVVASALPTGTNSIGTVILGAGSAAIGSVTQGTAAADSAPWPVRTVEPTVATYRAAFSVVVTGTGDFLEFLGNPTTTARITKITIVKPSAAVGIKVTKRSANDTVGTSTSLTLVPLDSANAASSATIKAYTVAPTQGASVGDIFPNMSVATTDQYTLDFGATIGQPIVVRNNQSLCLVTDASASTTIMGAIEWTER